MLPWFDFLYLPISALIIYFTYLIFKSYHHLPLSAKNKAVFITGCDSGFGYYFAKRMAEQGYRVFAGCLLPKGEGANSLRAFSSKIEVLPLDITKGQSVKESAKIVEEKLEKDEHLWAVINNAGIGHAGEIEWSPFETIEKVFDVNTFGMVRVTQEFLPLLIKAKGRIVNLTSISGIKRIPNMVPYSMSKAAASVFSDGIRLEMKKWDIKVINIQPYFYRTQITGKDNVISYLSNSWKNANSKTTSLLGNEYFESYLRKCKWFLNVVNCDRVEDVIQCLQDAVTSPNPNLYYRPGDLINKIFIGIPSYLPASIQDILHNFVAVRC